MNTDNAELTVIGLLEDLIAKLKSGERTATSIVTLVIDDDNKTYSEGFIIKDHLAVMGLLDKMQRRMDRLLYDNLPEFKNQKELDK